MTTPIASITTPFFYPEQSPILSFSACLAENPGWLKTENPGFSARTRASMCRSAVA